MSIRDQAKAPIALEPSREYIASVAAVEFDEYDPEKRIKLATIISDLSMPEPLECTDIDYENASPLTILSGLMIQKGDSRRRREAGPQQLVVTGNDWDQKPPVHMVHPSTGVVFFAEDFAVVARNPDDFAKAIRSKTQKSIDQTVHTEEDGVEIFTQEGLTEMLGNEHKKTRSAIHALDAKLIAMGALGRQLGTRRRVFLSMYRDLHCQPPHFKAKNLTKHTKTANTLIHRSVDLSAHNSAFMSEGSSLPGIHRAVHNNLYAGSEEERRANWRQYIAMLGRHTRAMIDKTEISSQVTTQIRDREIEGLPKSMQEKIKTDYPGAYAD